MKSLKGYAKVGAFSGTKYVRMRSKRVDFSQMFPSLGVVWIKCKQSHHEVGRQTKVNLIKVCTVESKYYSVANAAFFFKKPILEFKLDLNNISTITITFIHHNILVGEFFLAKTNNWFLELMLTVLSKIWYENQKSIYLSFHVHKENSLQGKMSTSQSY